MIIRNLTANTNSMNHSKKLRTKVIYVIALCLTCLTSAVLGNVTEGGNEGPSSSCKEPSCQPCQTCHPVNTITGGIGVESTGNRNDWSPNEQFFLTQLASGYQQWPVKFRSALVDRHGKPRADAAPFGTNVILPFQQPSQARVYFDDEELFNQETHESLGIKKRVYRAEVPNIGDAVWSYTYRMDTGEIIGGTASVTAPNDHQKWTIDASSCQILIEPYGAGGGDYYIVKFQSVSFGLGTWGRWTGTVRIPSQPGASIVNYEAGGTYATIGNREVPNSDNCAIIEGGVTTIYSNNLSYNTTGENVGKVNTLTKSKKIGTGDDLEIEQTQFEYYVSSDTGGKTGDLKKVTISVKSGGSWVPVGTSYHRYYPSHLVKYILSPEAYARMKRDGLTPETASDTTVANYADRYYEYDEMHRVSKEVAAGCPTCTSSGVAGDTFAYEVSTFDKAKGNWKTKTTVTHADGTKDITFANAEEHPILQVHVGTGSTPLKWYKFTKYDSNGRVEFTADSPAVTGYEDIKADLLDYTNSNYQYLSDTQGMIRTYTYNTAGLVEYEKIKHGETDNSPINQVYYTYTSNTVDGVTIRPMASKTIYPDGSTGVTTSYSYVYGSANEILQKTTTLPPVPTTQNGENVNHTIVEVYDHLGNVTWIKDERGYLTQQIWDTTTGRMTQRIEDVNTSIASGVPNSWDTTGLPGTRLHLVTDYTYDTFGRLTETLKPAVDAITDASAGTSSNVRHANWKVYIDGVNSDEVWTATGYKTVSAGAYTLINPVEIEKLNKSHGILEKIVSKRTSGSGALASSNTFSQSDWKGWKVNVYDTRGLNTDVKSYHLIPASGNGVAGTNYITQSIGYNAMGKINRTVSGDGTITQRVFDDKGRNASEWIGMNDSGATSTNPAGSGGSNNMVKVIEYEFDNGSAGAGNLTKETRYATSSDIRIVNYTYDWRNRPETLDGEIDYFAKAYYDNIGRVIKSERFNTNASGTLLSREETKYDDRGRSYQQIKYAVNSTGSVGNSLVGNIWYDASGNQIKSIRMKSGKFFVKKIYDGLSRVTANYYGYDSSESGYSDASSLTDDITLEQSELSYNTLGNVIQTIGYKRMHDATGTGALTASTARLNYSVNWIDPLGRTTSAASYGTNGGSSFTRPTNIPSRSDTVLVNSQFYDDSGDLFRVLDPKGLESRMELDALGRTTKIIEAYDDGDPATSTSDKDRVTEYTYNADGQVKTSTARMSSTNYQTTEYVYGVSSADGSDINSHAHLSSVKYSDPSTGAASSSYKDSYVYNRLGQIKKYTDRNGTIHEYIFDKLGRTTTDAVTNMASGVDGAVRRLVYSFDARGLIDFASSYDAATNGTLVNQVEREFNDYAQLTIEYQSHSGAVNTSTTPKVGYIYSNTSETNQIRLKSMTYPNGRKLRYEYSSGTDDAINRLSFIAEDSAGSIGNHVEEYTYLGFGNVIKRSHPEVGLTLSRIKPSGESNGDGGDQYTGYDRFGRIVDHRWLDGSNVDQDRYKYTYDRNSNRLSREGICQEGNLLYEDYVYDNLDRLKTVTPHGSSTVHQSWSLDALGNSSSVLTDGTSESRTHDKQNRLTQKGSHTLAFDTNGNTMTDQSGRTLIYDAWNRLVEVKNGSTSLIRYAYDALGRRVIEGGTHHYFSAAWQVLEERDSSNVPSGLNTWSPVYVDAMVCRDYDGGSGESVTTDRYYVTQDANFNMTGIAYVSYAGSMAEHYTYDAYGTRSIAGGGDTQYYFYFGHQGGKIDRQVPNLMLFRNRVYDTEAMRWVQQDPLKFVDGNNLYEYLNSSPGSGLDPEGLDDIRTKEGTSNTVQYMPEGIMGRDLTDQAVDLGTVDANGIVHFNPELGLPDMPLEAVQAMGGADNISELIAALKAAVAAAQNSAGGFTGGFNPADYQWMGVTCNECTDKSSTPSAVEYECVQRIALQGVKNATNTNVAAAVKAGAGVAIGATGGAILSKAPGYWKLAGVPFAVYGGYEIYSGVADAARSNQAIIAAKKAASLYCDCSKYTKK